MKVEKRPSKNGFGVFATAGMKAGESVLEWKGKIINSYSEAKAMSEDAEGHIIQFGKERYLDPKGTGRFVNHSCDPNCRVKIEGERVYLIALRDIEDGEEITFDYSTTMDEDNWEMECNCGSKNCRKNIRDFKYLPKKLRDHYIKLGIVPEYARRSAEK